MPPKKKARGASKAASSRSRESTRETLHTATATPAPTKDQDQTPAFDDINDPWTDEQEISLFKGIIRWKPAGMHKHFRMISIYQQLRSHGVTTANDHHTRIPGIWAKLKTLYNLEAIDQRENSLGSELDEEISVAARDVYFPFSLPEDEFGEMMFAKRLKPEGSSSPPTLSKVQTSTSRRVRTNQSIGGAGASAKGDTEEAPTRPKRGRPAGRGRGRGRVGRAKPEGRKSVSASDAGSTVQTTDTPASEDEDEQDDDEEEQDDSSDAGTPPAKAPRKPPRGGKRGKGPGRPRGGRGRAAAA
ncbi:MAG: hypothetical protein M1829_002196 [Trizodia sp. TS-e1964]|nr:MAG: hypothetical protein M1829_002196 [Trizodia sp. TS-e1964]